MRTIFLLIVYIVLSNNVYSQLEAKHMTVGIYQLLDVSSDSIINDSPDTTNSHIQFTNYNSIVSDAQTGELLFIGEHDMIRIKNDTMQNGELINTYCQRIAVSHSLESDLFYHFYNNCLYVPAYNQEGFSGGLYYAIIDISLDSGNGAVTSKDILVDSIQHSSRITAIKHCNEEDIWILSHEFNTRNFLAYKLTEVGLDTIPIISNIGTKHYGDYLNDSILCPFWDPTAAAVGELKASVTGERLICSFDRMEMVELYDFDRETGVVSNPITITFNDHRWIKGVELSPNCELLYVTTHLRVYDSLGVLLYHLNELHQFDISMYDSTSIMNSHLVIEDDIVGSWYPNMYIKPISGQLQLGINGNIYTGTTFALTPYVGVISNPNIYGQGSLFDSTYLANNIQNYTNPFSNLPHWYFYHLGDTTNACDGYVNTLNEQTFNPNKKLIQIVDLLGRETKPQANVPLFYRYSNGIVEKKVLLD